MFIRETRNWGLLLLSLLFLNCSEEKPKVKIINESEKRIDADFVLKDCACPSFSFQNIFPLNETDYRSCSAKEYIIYLKDSLSTFDTSLNAEMDKRYDIHYSSNKCSITTSNQ
jgi:hypothetical protein